MTYQFDSKSKYRISTADIRQLQSIVGLTNPLYLSDYTDMKTDISNVLKETINPDSGIIDGDKLKESIFPTDKYGFPDFDVFISHSHNDLDLAKQLAAFLRDYMGMTPFLDNYVWGSADALLEEIDKTYCKTTDKRYYNYNKRNFSTSHVHTMLSMSILEMISRCKAFVFIGSSESLNLSQINASGPQTLSPWIYQELQFARTLSAVIDRQLNEQRSFSSGGVIALKIAYTADLSDFKPLTASKLKYMAVNKERL